MRDFHLCGGVPVACFARENALGIKEKIKLF